MPLMPQQGMMPPGLAPPGMGGPPPGMGGGMPPGMGGPPPGAQGPQPGSRGTAVDKMRAIFDLARDAYDDDPDDESSMLIVDIMRAAQKYMAAEQKLQDGAMGGGSAMRLLRRG